MRTAGSRLHHLSVNFFREIEAGLLFKRQADCFLQRTRNTHLAKRMMKESETSNRLPARCRAMLNSGRTKTGSTLLLDNHERIGLQHAQPYHPMRRNRRTPPPEPLIQISLAERRTGCVSDLLIINELIETLCRGSDPTAIDNLIFADAETRKVIAAVSDDERSILAQHMRDHGMRIDPQLLDPERWQCLIDIFRHRANLPT
jgi:hypothetical protein